MLTMWDKFDAVVLWLPTLKHENQLTNIEGIQQSVKIFK